MKECKYAKDYKGIHRPRCNEKKGCDTCWDIYKAATMKKIMDNPKVKRDPDFDYETEEKMYKEWYESL
jgi:hypothetical protein